jgi:hypothetical protein
MTFNDCVDCPPEVLDAMPCGCPPTAFARCKGGWIRCNERYAAWSRWQDESLLGRMVAADRKPEAGTPATDESPDDESSPRADAFGNEYPTDFDLAEQYYGKPGGEPATDESAAHARTRAELARVREELGGTVTAWREDCEALSVMTAERDFAEENFADAKRIRARIEAERDEIRRRADVMSQVLTPVMMLLGHIIECDEESRACRLRSSADIRGLHYLEDAAAQARPILAKLQALPQHTVASTDQPHLSEVTTSTMPRSAPVASEGEGPLGDGGIEE